MYVKRNAIWHFSNKRLGKKEDKSFLKLGIEMRKTAKGFCSVAAGSNFMYGHSTTSKKSMNINP